MERKLVESQINNLYCRACEFPVKEDFIVCPNCLKKLKNVCTNCKNLLEVNWLACPYCSYSQITLPAAAEDKSKVESRSEMKKRGRGRPKKLTLEQPNIVAKEMPLQTADVKSETIFESSAAKAPVYEETAEQPQN